MDFQNIQPRNFEPSRARRRDVAKRTEHVMLIGGRDGPAVAMLPPRDPKFWSEGAQERWTRELETDATYPDAKTQSRLLREVRPEQRLYGRGYMRVADMTEVLLRNLALNRGRPLPTELTVVQDNGELLALSLIVREGPVFTGLLPTKGAENFRGAPITWSKGDAEDLLDDVLAAGREFASLGLPIYVTAKDGTRTRVLGPKKEGGKIVAQTAEFQLSDVQAVDLLDPSDFNIQDKPFFARLVGVMGEFEGNLQVYPYFLIARLRPIRRQREGLPVPQAATFLGDVTKTDKLRKKAAAHLKRFADETWAALMSERRKDETIFEVAVRDPASGLKIRVDEDKTLYWSPSPAAEFDPVALLRPLYPGTGAIVVNVDDYLRLSRMVNAQKPSGSVKSNPSRGPMRHFGNPVHYLSDRELQVMAASEGLSVPALLKKYQGHVLPKSERPRSASRGAEPAFMSAGRRAAATGAGLRLTRSNPFQKVTEPGPGKIQVTSKRGKTLYMTQNQIAKMGSKMLAPGEVERALSRSNPKRRYVTTTWGGHQYIPGGDEDDIGIAMMQGVGKASSKKGVRKVERFFGAQDPRETVKLRPGERAYEVVYRDAATRRQASEFMTGTPATVKREAKKRYGAGLMEVFEVKPGMGMDSYANPRSRRGVNDEVPGSYDEAEFQRHMAHLGMKSNPRRAAPMRGLDTEEAWQEHLKHLRDHAPDSMYRQFLREYAAWKRGKRPHLSRGAAMVDDYFRRFTN